jgi:hypothetical protein
MEIERDRDRDAPRLIIIGAFQFNSEALYFLKEAILSETLQHEIKGSNPSMAFISRA